MERFVYRDESALQDPANDPIRAIVVDRLRGRYNLLTESSRSKVLHAINGVGDEGRLVVQQPFPVDLELGEMVGNTKLIELPPGQPANLLSAPLSIYIEVSPRCNLTCKDCYQGFRPDNFTVMESLTIKRLMQNLAEIGVAGVRFTGKEPTTRSDLPLLISEGRALGLKMALNTNGVFGRGYAQKLVNVGIQEVVVSIDGNQGYNDAIRGDGVYNKAVRTVDYLVTSGIDTRINMTVSRTNMEDIEEIAHLAHNLGSYVSYIPMRNLGYASTHMSSVLLTPKDMEWVAKTVTRLRHQLMPTRLLTYFDVFDAESDYYHPMFQMDPCIARKNGFVAYNGDVYPCDHLVGLGRLYWGGNIRQQKFLDLWRHSEGLWRYRLIGRNEQCNNCDFFGKKCHGGCTSEYLMSCRGNTTQVDDRLCFVKYGEEKTP